MTIVDFLHQNNIISFYTRYNTQSPLFKFARSFHEDITNCGLQARSRLLKLKKEGARNFLLNCGFVLPKKPHCIAFKYFDYLSKYSL